MKNYKRDRSRQSCTVSFKDFLKPLAVNRLKLSRKPTQFMSTLRLSSDSQFPTFPSLRQVLDRVIISKYFNSIVIKSFYITHLIFYIAKLNKKLLHGDSYFFGQSNFLSGHQLYLHQICAPSSIT